MMKTTPLLLSLLAFAACATAVHTLGSSDCVVFLGDSITEQGAAPGGYVSMIRDSLSARYPGIRVIGAGISGNKVPDLQRRLERDVLSKRPTLVVVYIGINDVWHSILPGHSGTPAGEYESGLTDIMKCLLIEDDHDTAAYIRSGLEQLGHTVDWVADGHQGLLMATDPGYGVLIVDRMLPRMDGLSVVRTLRAAAVKTPALFLTTLGGIDDRVEGLEAGGDDYLIKPFAFSEMSIGFQK